MVLKSSARFAFVSGTLSLSLLFFSVRAYFSSLGQGSSLILCLRFCYLAIYFFALFSRNISFLTILSSQTLYSMIMARLLLK